MKVFLDTNIIIDFYDKRGEFSRDLLIMCRLQMNSWKQFSLTNRKARQDFEGLGELFSFLFPESGSIYFFMLLALVAAETIGEREAYDSAKVQVRPPVLFLTARSAVNDVVEGFELGGNDYLKKPFFLSINKRIECFFEVFVEPLGWVICYLMLA